MTVLNTFSNALRHHSVSATADERAVLGPDGEPAVIVGRDALVTRVRRANGQNAALRVPLDARAGGDWPIRYAALERFRADSRVGARLPAGIAVKRDALATGTDAEGGVGLPAVSMEWIDGPTLLDAVDRACSVRNTGILTAIYRALLDAVNDARVAGFVHGDLAADNLMIRPTGQMAFIDLDGATWRDAPCGVAGRGTPGYRHPGGNGRQPSSRDEFATLVLLASLLILSEQPELRRQYGDPPHVQGGALLFSAWDISDPSTSRLFGLLRGSVRPATRTVLDALASACAADPDEAATFTAGVAGLKPFPKADEPRNWSAGWTQSPFSDDVENVLPSLRARMGAQPAPAPQPMDALGQETVQTPAAAPRFDGNLEVWRDRLQRAIDRNDDLTVSRLWPSLKHDPAVQTMAYAVAEIIAGGYDKRIAQEAKRGRDDLVARLAEDARHHGLAISTESRKSARAARERLATRHALEQALAHNEQQALADLAISGRLAELGDADRESVRRVLRALEWPNLSRALDSDDDRLILGAYDEELFSQSDALEQTVRERIELARQRSSWLEEVRASLRRRDAHLLARSFAKPPPGAESRLSTAERKRAFRLIERERAIAELNTAIQERDEAKIIAALGFVERVGARIGDRADWSIVKRVVDRVSLIHDLKEAVEARPVDYGRIARLLPAIRALGLEGDPRLTGPIEPRHLARELVRNAHLRRIRIALKRDDDVAIAVAALPDPYDAYHLLRTDEQLRVDLALQNRNRTRPESPVTTWPTAG
jgi:serine/threonine protein kinase